VRSALYEVWGHQACAMNPADWPAMFERLMKAPRHDFRMRFEQAVTALAEAYRDGPPADGANVVFAYFPMLNFAHRSELARRLVALASAEAEALA
jgi:hypothetical protein